MIGPACELILMKEDKERYGLDGIGLQKIRNEKIISFLITKFIQ
jgi:hypothetical protein